MRRWLKTIADNSEKRSLRQRLIPILVGVALVLVLVLALITVPIYMFGTAHFINLLALLIVPFALGVIVGLALGARREPRS